MSSVRLSLLLSAFLFLFSCGGPSGVDNGQSGFAVRVRLEAAAPVLNPYMPSPGYSRYVAANVFQTLGILDPESLELKPLLLTEIPELRRVEEGPYEGMLAYDFQINPLAKWDNGSAVTGEDVAFTLKLIFHPLLPTAVWRGYFEQLQGLEIDGDDPQKFTAYFDPYYMLALESMCQVPIYPAYHYDPEGRMKDIPLADLMDPEKARGLGESDSNLSAFATQFQEPEYSNEASSISGSNAYRLGAFTGDDGLFLLKKENWWGDEAAEANEYLRAFPDTLIYRVVKDDAALENMLKNGELDVAASINPTRFIEMQKDPILTEKYDFSTRWSTIYSRWMLNNRNPILADKKVRQALAHVVDYDFLVNTVLHGLANRTIGPVNPKKEFYNREVEPYQYNIDKAKVLLTEAGWTDTDGDGIVDKVVNGKKTPLSIKLATSASTTISEQTANSLVKTARLAGVDVQLDIMEFNQLTAGTRSGDFETAVFAAALYPGLVELYQNFHSKSLAPAGDNRAGIANSELDRIIEQIRSTRNDAERTELYKQAQAIIHDEVPEVYLYASRQRYIASKRFDYVLSSNRPGYYEAYFKLKQ